MTDGDPCGGLNATLLRVAISAERSDALYVLLREFCHELRNRLNSLKLSLYLARRGEPPETAGRWERLEEIYRDLEGFVEQLQGICRPFRLVPVRLALGMLIQERRAVWCRWMAERGRDLQVAGPREGAVGTLDPMRLAQALDALVRWRADLGAPGTPARLAWSDHEDHFELEWTEPARGPVDLDAADDDAPVSLALPLLARVIAAHGGTVELGTSGGLDLRLRWPIEAHCPRAQEVSR